MNVNKSGTDWLVIKAWLEDKISELHTKMEFPQSIETYNELRGAILTARQLIEEVEPTTLPKTEQDDYGISDPQLGH